MFIFMNTYIFSWVLATVIHNWIFFSFIGFLIRKKTSHSPKPIKPRDKGKKMMQNSIDDNKEKKSEKNRNLDIPNLFSLS